jgi:predicted metallopeptidase
MPRHLRKCRNYNITSERNLDLHDTEPGLTDATDENIVTLPPNHCHNLNSHETQAVSAQVAQLYSRHFSFQANVTAESQEIAALYKQHFPDTVAGTTDAVAESDNTAAASVNSSVGYYDDDDAYDATYDDRDLQQEAGAVPKHYYTRQCQGRSDWGIQDPGWHELIAPTDHPDAAPPSSHRLQDLNVRVTKFTDKLGYTIENADIIYRLPSAPGNTLRYHPPFVPGTLEHQLHRCPLSERLHVIHQLRDILLTEKEEMYIRGQMDPISATFSLSLGTSEILCQTERYHDSMEHLDYEQSKCRTRWQLYVMKILIRLHQINAIVRSREEHAARTINACAAAGLRDRHEC